MSRVTESLALWQISPISIWRKDSDTAPGFRPGFWFSDAGRHLPWQWRGRGDRTGPRIHSLRGIYWVLWGCPWGRGGAVAEGEPALQGAAILGGHTLCFLLEDGCPVGGTLKAVTRVGRHAGVFVLCWGARPASLMWRDLNGDWKLLRNQHETGKEHSSKGTQERIY